MQTERIINRRPNPARGEMFLQLVPPRNTDDVLVINVMIR